MYNPNYDYKKLDLEIISFDRSDGCYQFDEICFWATKEGHIYTASDSGCSCPTPFEGYSGEDQKSVLQQLERIGSIDQAMTIFESWRDGSEYINDGDAKQLKDWLEKRFKR